MAAVQGERVPGGFILITGIAGIHYAVRPQAVASHLEINPWVPILFW
jgi:hypothetical protein